ncbi:MAG: flagellar biosynthetic protein FliO, partial [Clostridia bacterium]
MSLSLLGRPDGGPLNLLKRSPARFMEQVDYLPLGPKRGIAMAQVVDKTVASGISEVGIQLLQEVFPMASVTPRMAAESGGRSATRAAGGRGGTRAADRRTTASPGS